MHSALPLVLARRHVLPQPMRALVCLVAARLVLATKGLGLRVASNLDERSPRSEGMGQSSKGEASRLNPEATLEIEKSYLVFSLQMVYMGGGVVSKVGDPPNGFGYPFGIPL